MEGFGVVVVLDFVCGEDDCVFLVFLGEKWLDLLFYVV